MKRSKDELVSAIREFIGDDTSDKAIQIIEDVSDSFTDDSDEWKRKYEENDRDWRKRYMDRFMNPEPMPNTPDPITTPGQVIEDNKEDIQDELESTTIDDLFEEREG